MKSGSFWKGPGGLIVIALALGGVIALFVFLAGASPRGTVGSSTDAIKVDLTGCDATSLTATASLTITNTDSRTRNATIDVEYRDGSGARLDTDTAYVRDIPPGDTVKHDESTILDAEPSGTVTCIITKIDSY